jgi:UDP-glucuronate decarboxylase
MDSADEVTGPVNIGNPDEFTMLELAKRVLEETGSTSLIEHHPLPVDDPVRRRPDITRARELLGWEPTVPFSDGITRTVEFFRTHLAANG